MMDFNGQDFHSDCVETYVFGSSDAASSTQRDAHPGSPASSPSKQAAETMMGSRSRRTEIPLLTATAPGEFDFLGAS